MREMFAQHMRQHGRMKPETASDRSSPVGCDHVDGIFVVILIALMGAADIEIGPAALFDENVMAQPELPVEQLLVISCVVVVDDLDHEIRSALVCANEFH